MVGIYKSIASHEVVTVYAYADGNPISYTDPLGLWSVDLGGYVGAGGEVIFGSDNGHGFLTVRLGFGIGVAAEFDRKGGIPGGTARPSSAGSGGKDRGSEAELHWYRKIEGGRFQ